MKRIVTLSVCFLFILTISSYAQRDTILRKQVPTAAERAALRIVHEQRADSVIANREVVRMKESFTITPKQEQQLYMAGITISQQRRAVYKQYWKTEGFRTEMAKVDASAEALYTSIVGAENYKTYKATMNSRLDQRMQLMRNRYIADSLNRKSQ